MDKYTELEKIVAAQTKQIETLKRGMVMLQNRLMQVTQKTERAYHTGRKNSTDILNIIGMVRKGR